MAFSELCPTLLLAAGQHLVWKLGSKIESGMAFHESNRSEATSHCDRPPLKHISTI